MVWAGLCLLTACVSVGSERFALDGRQFERDYPQIRAFVIDVAAGNGFGQLTSEIKPSEFNHWKGQLFFQLKTTNGTDQLFVEFEPRGDQVSVWVHGAGTRSDPRSAAKAIQARLTTLGNSPRPRTEAMPAAPAPVASPPPRPAPPPEPAFERAAAPKPAAPVSAPVKAKAASDARAKVAPPASSASGPAGAAAAKPVAASAPAAKAATKKPATSPLDN